MILGSGWGAASLLKAGPVSYKRQLLSTEQVNVNNGWGTTSLFSINMLVKLS